MSFLQPIGDLFHAVFYEPVYNVLMVLYEVLHPILPAGGFALSIVVLTLLLRAALIPLTRKQLKSSRAMQELQPRLKELQARYKNNPQELMAAQQALYREHGVNPVSGCLPLVIQMPFIYALYYSFFAVLQVQKITVNGHQVLETSAQHLMRINHDLYPFVPSLTHLPDTAFFWTSLATADPLHILPVIAAVLTFLQLRMALPVRSPAAAGQKKDSMSQATGMMQYVMPVMTLVIGLTFPAGLALYWCISTLFSAVQQYFISGWGSLFVGIPGMEHLVPAPKQPVTITPSRAVSVGSARALTPPATTTPSEGGVRGLFRQIREQLGAVQRNALDAQKAKQSGAEPGSSQKAARSATAAPDTTAESAPATKADGAPRRERQRPSKAGPVLVKPPAARSATGEAPEAAAPDTSGPAPVEASPLSASDITHIAPNGTNGTNGANGKSGVSSGHTHTADSGKNGNVPASGARRAAPGVKTSTAQGSGRPPTPRPGGQGTGSGQRKTSGASSSKGPQSARSRSGRPKGGR